MERKNRMGENKMTRQEKRDKQTEQIQTLLEQNGGIDRGRNEQPVQEGIQ